MGALLIFLLLLIPHRTPKTTIKVIPEFRDEIQNEIRCRYEWEHDLFLLCFIIITSHLIRASAINSYAHESPYPLRHINLIQGNFFLRQVQGFLSLGTALKSKHSCTCDVGRIHHTKGESVYNALRAMN